MENWKKQPYLFANGKFKVNINNDISYKILGITPGSFLLEDKTIQELFYAKIQSCTLIARPISDMTDEEINNSPLEHNLHEQSRKWCLHNIRSSTWSDMMLYLLSIGVYPFENTEDIIFKPKK